MTRRLPDERDRARCREHAAASSPLVLRADAGGVATLTLNRPRAVQRDLDGAMLDALQAALDAIAADASVRVVVIAGAGRAFCAGHDLKEMLAQLAPRRSSASCSTRCSRVMLTMQRAAAAGDRARARHRHRRRLPARRRLRPRGGGRRTRASRRPASTSALFCATPGVPVSRNISRKRAFEMLFTGEFIDAPTALAWGLVNRVVPPAELDAEVARARRA